MKCTKMVVVLAVFAIAFCCSDYLVAGTRSVKGKNTASSARSNYVDKSGKKAAQSNRQVPNRGNERDIAKLMKNIRLPAVSFKPPATIVDAVEFFRHASKEYDSTDIPVEERGFNFVFKISGGDADVPVLPPIFLNAIAFDEALKLVCESVGYMFTVQGGMVIVMPDAFCEMEHREYSLKATFVKVLDSLGAFKKHGEPLKEVFFKLGGIDWPEGASIACARSSGKLKVYNTCKNIAILEQVLCAFNATVAPLTSSKTRLHNHAIEQDVVERMKEMLLPVISFRPPSSMVDVVEFFHTVSKDFDRPDIPKDERGFNFVLRRPMGKVAWPLLQPIVANNITFDEALKFVCESVWYKFTVRGNIVFIEPNDYNEMEFRTYSIQPSFQRKVREMSKYEPFDWDRFVCTLGVDLPDDSTVIYIESAGKLFVRNTSENISTLEHVLKRLKAIY